MNQLHVYLQRKLRQLKRLGCDIKHMHEYFCIPNNINDERTICLDQDEDNNSKLNLTIRRKQRDCTPFESYIKELPRDVNNYIYEFLAINRRITYSLTLPNDYPFNVAAWSLKSYIVNKKNTQYTGYDPNDIYCGHDYSPCMIFDKEILMYISKLDWFID